MRLTTKGRFAVTAMIDLALHGDNLEQLFGKLRRNKLVSSVRGPGGGYRLMRPMNKVSVADIILAVDEPIDATQCKGKENCHNDQRCMTHDLWTSLNAKIRDYLTLITLEQLVTSPKVKSVAVLQDLRVRK